MNERPETFAELRKMIREAKGIYVTAPFNDISLSVPITKEFAYDLYKGFSGEYRCDGYAAYWDDDAKELQVN